MPETKPLSINSGHLQTVTNFTDGCRCQHLEVPQVFKALDEYRKAGLPITGPKLKKNFGLVATASRRSSKSTDVSKARRNSGTRALNRLYSSRATISARQEIFSRVWGRAQKYRLISCPPPDMVSFAARIDARRARVGRLGVAFRGKTPLFWSSKGR